MQFNYWVEPLARPYGSYDFDSIMQYDACAFSTCGEDCDPMDAACRAITVLPRNEAWQTQLGQRDHLTAMDRMVMSFLYPRSNWRFVNPRPSDAGSGTFLAPFHLLALAVGDVPEDGTIWLVRPGNYEFSGTIRKGMTLRAPLGGALIGH